MEELESLKRSVDKIANKLTALVKAYERKEKQFIPPPIQHFNNSTI
jgi:hypothetical protein